MQYLGLFKQMLAVEQALLMIQHHARMMHQDQYQDKVHVLF